MNIHDVYGLFFRLFRERRMREFQRLFPCATIKSAIDLGGSRYQWDLLKWGGDVTILNLDMNNDGDAPPNYQFAIGDARETQYPDRTFDLAFSNSVIEHVGGWEDQMRFAREIRRLADNIYCQTPNRWFPVERHLLAPFLHWFGGTLPYPVIRYLTLWGLITKPSVEQAHEFVSSIRLLSKREMKALFPDCTIVTERVLLLPKSFIAVRIRPS